MELSAALLYSLRYIPKLLLPQVIVENISKLNRQKNVYNKLINYKNNNLTDNLKLINNYLTLLHT